MALAIAAAGPAADATVIWSGPVNLNIPSNLTGLYLNVVTGQHNVGGGGGNTVPGWTINPWGDTGLFFFVTGSSAGTQHIARTGGGAVANNQHIDIIGSTPIYGGWSGANLNASTIGNQPFFLNSSTNIYGFRFTHNGNTHYGWARISLGNGLAGSPRTLVEYAWQDQPNVPIWAALVPIGVCCFNNQCTYTSQAGCPSGTWLADTSCDFDPCAEPRPCLADIAPQGGDGSVNIDDLLIVINQWGPCPAPAVPGNCPADVHVSGVVDVDDLLAVINDWGTCGR